ncbi:hypothetical protein C8J56DRAFT_899698 [Mycena floridula]|nr:hypothetical protein C8J56DRAFT_900680 [Mycena floridula]KAJ7576594.1 hypothetical protein C8J56DRAFT_899698 [Mycena floridula]
MGLIILDQQWILSRGNLGRTSAPLSAVALAQGPGSAGNSGAAGYRFGLTCSSSGTLAPWKTELSGVTERSWVVLNTEYYTVETFHYESHLWDRLLGGSKIQTTLMMEPNGDRHYITSLCLDYESHLWGFVRTEQFLVQDHQSTHRGYVPRALRSLGFGRTPGDDMYTRPHDLRLLVETSVEMLKSSRSMTPNIGLIIYVCGLGTVSQQLYHTPLSSGIFKMLEPGLQEYK